MQQSEQQLIKQFLVDMQLVPVELANRCMRAVAARRYRYLAQALAAQGHPQLATIKDLASLEKQFGPLIEGYRIQKKLGEGGLGAVYKAEQISLSRHVAIKILLPQAVSNPRHVGRFIREAMASGKLAHPNIVRGLDFGQVAEMYYIVMEYVEGQALDTIVQRSGPLSERAAMRITQYICQALQHIWANGYLHRDIKPENILISRQRTVKLCDLGLAKPSDDNQSAITIKGMVVGTPEYMSPEQILEDDELDYRIDVYALGATLYYMLAGHPPFEEPDQVKLLTAHIKAVPPLLSEIGVNVSPSVEKFVMQLLSKDPAKRCHSPEQLMTEIISIRRGLSAPNAERPIAARTHPGTEQHNGYSKGLLWPVGLLCLLTGILLGFILANLIRGG